MVDPLTNRPTQQGVVWLRLANVQTEDILLFNKESAGKRRRLAAHSVNKNVRTHLNQEQRIKRTLALLKIAYVIEREKLEKVQQIAYNRSLVARSRLGSNASPQIVLKNAKLELCEQTFSPPANYESALKDCNSSEQSGKKSRSSCKALYD